ncbi:MAG: DUF899 domain-containing protein [Thermoleophilaceae bacterium]
MTEIKVGTVEEWRAARESLLAREKELTRRNDALARERRELPWVPVEKDYSFDTEAGTKTLADLFDGRSQLVVYNFMFGPDYEAGCPVCSSSADSFDGAVPHMNARDVTFLCISRAPLDNLLAYRERMGWSFPWVSSQGTDFNFDFHASQTKEQSSKMVEGGAPPVVSQMAEDCGTDPAGYLTEAPVLNSFAQANGAVYHTYSTTARGLEFMMGYYGFLDRAPLGRNESDSTQFWLRRQDEYGG